MFFNSHHWIEAVKKVGISRNTYYYKDYVFKQRNISVKYTVISMVLCDEKGSLSSVINLLSESDSNILTISQAVPIGGLANVLITLDISNLKYDLKRLLVNLQALSCTKSVILNAIE